VVSCCSIDDLLYLYIMHFGLSFILNSKITRIFFNAVTSVFGFRCLTASARMHELVDKKRRNTSSLWL